MLFADYGESITGARRPGYAGVDPLSHRQASGMLVYGHANGRQSLAMSPALPQNFQPVLVGTTDVLTPKSATQLGDKAMVLGQKSTTLPSTYTQTTTLPPPKPAPTTSTSPPFVPAPTPRPMPLPPTTIPTTYDTSTAPASTSSPARSKAGWYVAGGLGLAALLGGAYLVYRR